MAGRIGAGGFPVVGDGGHQFVGAAEPVEGRAQGWALVDQELEEGLRSIAAPIRDADGQVIAAINVSTHAGRRTLNSIVEELLQPLLATARRIELDLARSRASVRARPDA